MNLTLFARCAVGKVRVFVAEEADAVHVVVTDSPRVRPRPPSEHDGWALVGHYEASVLLSEPIGRRPVVDAPEGTARRRVASGEEYERRLSMNVQGRFAAGKWTYDADGHTIHSLAPLTSSRNRWQESRSVSVAVLNGEVDPAPRPSK